MKPFVRFDPRSKIIMLIISMIAATTASSLLYICALILLIGGVGLLSGRFWYSLIGTVVFIALYISNYYLPDYRMAIYIKFFLTGLVLHFLSFKLFIKFLCFLFIDIIYRAITIIPLSAVKNIRFKFFH